MSPEVGPEGGNFWPPRSEIAGINIRNFERTLYIVQKAGMELKAKWTQQPLGTSDVRRASASTLPGGAPDSYLELLLSNTGLSASEGTALGVAVAGAAASHRRIRASTPAALISTQGSHTAWAHLVDISASDMPALVFTVPPLPRRSSRHFSLMVGRSIQGHGPRSLRVCVAEAPASRHAGGDRRPAPTVCRCSGFASLHGPDDELGSSSELQNFSWVHAQDAADGPQSLCAAAATAVSEHAPRESSETLLQDPSNAVVGAAVVPGARHDLHATMGVKAYESGILLLLAITSLVLGVCAVVQMQHRSQSTPLTVALRREADDTASPRLPAELRGESMLELTASLRSNEV